MKAKEKAIALCIALASLFTCEEGIPDEQGNA